MKRTKLIKPTLKKKTIQPRYMLCIRNAGYDAALETRKVYNSLPDNDASKHQMLRIVDETQEDYLYPADYFVPIAISKSVAKLLEKNA